MATWTPTTIPVVIGGTTYHLRGIVSDDSPAQLVLGTSIIGTDGVPIDAEDLGNGQGLNVNNLAQSLVQGIRLKGDPVTDDAPVYIGIRSTTSLVNDAPTVDDEMQPARGTADGKLITLGFCNPEDEITQTPVVLTTTGDVLLQAAQGSGIKTYLTGALISNSSATDTTVLFKDTISGRVIPVPAPKLAAGGGGPVVFPQPLKGASNSIWNLALSIAATSVTVTPFGYKTKV